MKPKRDPDYPDYLFYSDGSIRTMLKLYDDKDRKPRTNRMYGKILKFHLHTSDDNLMCNLKHRDGKRKTVYPHIITAKLFVPNPENKRYVGFKNGNKKNIDYTNLYWKNHNINNPITVDEKIKKWEKIFNK